MIAVHHSPNSSCYPFVVKHFPNHQILTTTTIVLPLLSIAILLLFPEYTQKNFFRIHTNGIIMEGNLFDKSSSLMITIIHASSAIHFKRFLKYFEYENGFEIHTCNNSSSFLLFNTIPLYKSTTVCSSIHQLTGNWVAFRFW